MGWKSVLQESSPLWHWGKSAQSPSKCPCTKQQLSHGESWWPHSICHGDHVPCSTCMLPATTLHVASSSSLRPHEGRDVLVTRRHSVNEILLFTCSGRPMHSVSLDKSVQRCLHLYVCLLFSKNNSFFLNTTLSSKIIIFTHIGTAHFFFIIYIP